MRYTNKQVELYLSYLNPNQLKNLIEELDAAIVDAIDSGGRWVIIGVRNVI